MTSRKLPRFAIIAFAALLWGCPTEEMPPDATLLDAAGDLPPVVSGTVEILEAPESLELGESAQLSARVIDNEGNEIHDAEILWTLSAHAAATIDADGVITARQPGYYEVFAYWQHLVSEPTSIHIIDPAQWVLREVDLQVELPPELGERELHVAGPVGSAESIDNGDGSFGLEILQRSNQVAMAADADTGDLLMMRLFRGENELLEAEPDAPMNIHSTAEALIFASPGLADPSPFALETIRTILADSSDIDRFAAVLTALSRDGDSWINHPDVVYRELDLIHQRLATDLEPYIAQAMEPYVMPTGYLIATPPERSGLEVLVHPCGIESAHEECGTLGSDYGVVEVRNWHVRYVSVYFQPATIGAEVTNMPEPMSLASATIINDFWQVVWELVTELTVTIGDNQTLFRAVNFNPASGGADRWFLYAYGLGVQPSTIPVALRDAETTMYRMAMPVARTILVDIVLNFLSIFTAIDPFDTLTIGQLDELETAIKRSTLASDSLSFVHGNDKLGDIVLGNLIGNAINDALPLIAGALPVDFPNLAGQLASSMISFLSSFISAFDAVVAVIHLGASLWAAAYDSFAEFFTVGDGFGYLEPLSRWLPDAELGCPYEAVIGVSRDFADAMPHGTTFDWTVELVERVGGTVEIAESGLFAHFTIGSVALEGVFVDDGVFSVWARASSDPPGFHDYAEFFASVNDYKVEVASAEWVDVSARGAEPASTVTLRVAAAACEEIGRNIRDGEVTGDIVAAGTADLSLRGEYLVATFELAEPLADDVRHSLEIRVWGDNESETIGSAELLIANSAPTVIAPSMLFVNPGDALELYFGAMDANFMGTNPSEIPVSGIATPSQPAEFRTTPAASELTYRFETAPPEWPGALAFRGSTPLTVALPHADNDGTTGEPHNAAGESHIIPIVLSDDDGEVGVLAGFSSAFVGVNVRNVAPVITNEVTELVVTDGEPSTIEIAVADDNGLADIGAVEIVGEDRGFLFDVSTDADNHRVAAFVASAVDLGDCAEECTISFRAQDADDVPDNGGYSEIFVLSLTESGETTCSGNGDCEGTEYCWANGGRCDAAESFCRDRPSGCEAAAAGSEPTCGCDGNFYLSACEAERAGVAPEGPGGSSSCDELEKACDTADDCVDGEGCWSPVGLCGGGLCVATPASCPADFEVCGCDAVSYDNACEALIAGAGVVSLGACGASCTSACGAGQTCYRPNGACFDAGVCIAADGACTSGGGSVCGCDGTTYPCPEAAYGAGTSIYHSGPCSTCTNVGGRSDDCPGLSYCLAETCDGDGTCVPMNLHCDDAAPAACGCDGKMYTNACSGLISGVSPAPTSDTCACAGPIEPAGTGEDGSACPSATYCQRDNCRGGFCTPYGWMECTGSDVCACDGETYSSTCLAIVDGGGVAPDAVCDPSCRSDLDCPGDQYCQFAYEICAGLGECQDKPDVTSCATDTEVCGCDGLTYPSDCHRQAAGVSLAEEGPCEQCEVRHPIPCDGVAEVCRAFIPACPGTTDTGHCVQGPLTRSECADVFEPVCDCNANFQSMCHALLASVEYEFKPSLVVPMTPLTSLGACPCTSDSDCWSRDGDMFCLRDEDGCLGEGQCVFLDHVPELSWPLGEVCGCDGLDYTGRDQAYTAGVNVYAEGSCGDSCRNDDDCLDGSYCQYPFEACGGLGSCVEPPAECPDGAGEPDVCGCDGQTWESACSASQSSVSVSAADACAACDPNGPNGCWRTGATCNLPAGYCDESEGPPPVAAGCATRPDTCPDAWDPVCSCDGQQYDSLCEARADGANVTSTEYCPCSAGVDSIPCVRCVCDARPECCEGRWTAECEAYGLGACLEACRCPDLCCDAQDHPGCDVPACEACVCDEQPSCCTDEWTAGCAQLAADTCAASCPCLEGACEPHDQVGTVDPDCWRCVCAEDISCCTEAWDEDCVELGSLECVDDCGCAGLCCTPHEPSGCSLESCEDAVCAERPACCDGPWTVECAIEAQEQCPVSCGYTPCCESHEGVGCEQETCEDTVCLIDPDCCETEWTDGCADLAWTECDTLCTSASCCEVHAEPNCDDTTCRDEVCATLPECCTDEWDQACVDAAADCYVCRSGPCCDSNLTPGCEPELAGYDYCQNTVCTEQPSCCDTIWDASCAALADEYCPGLCSAGSCCTIHASSPGCSDSTCRDDVCAMKPDCCTVGWTPWCKALAERFCGLCEAPRIGGSCCNAHGGLGCNDLECTEEVCRRHPACCSVGWSATCAEIAEHRCTTCNSRPCLTDHSGVGCSDADCAAAACEYMPVYETCCETGWDDAACMVAANYACPELESAANCCTTTSGCWDGSCRERVEELAPWCTNSNASAWNEGCAALARELCGGRGCPCPDLDCPEDWFEYATYGGRCADYCSECPMAVVCEPGQMAVDSNRDGCLDWCVDAPERPVEIVCPRGMLPMDLNGDGTDDYCKRFACTVEIECTPEEIPWDTDGDGCWDVCAHRIEDDAYPVTGVDGCLYCGGSYTEGVDLDLDAQRCPDICVPPPLCELARCNYPGCGEPLYADISECAVSICDPNDGITTHPRNEGHPCVDFGNHRCVLDGTCRDGECVPNTDRCNDGNACTMDTCVGPSSPFLPGDPGEEGYDGVCVNLGEGSEGSWFDEFFFAGCDDYDPCTADSCDPVEGCLHEPIASCSPPLAECDEDGDCDDSERCTVDWCSRAGYCEHETKEPCCTGVEGDCDDGDPSTEDRCTETGSCVHSERFYCVTDEDCYGENLSAQPCYDMRCWNGECLFIGGLPNNCCETTENCDDGNPCTVDRCDDPGWVIGGTLVCMNYFAPAPGCCRAAQDCVPQTCMTRGCEDSQCSYAPIPGCDPCESLTCPVGEIPVDTDDDDCVDACSPPPCDGMGVETCNGADDDCNGVVDDKLKLGLCRITNEHGMCEGVVICNGQAGTSCTAATPAPELCDGTDNNCNGVVDDTDINSDDDELPDCADPDDDNDGSDDGDDCAPLDAAIHPGAVDEIDGGYVDANCDGADGNLGAAVFVAPDGVDSDIDDAGTRDAPFQTIQYAIDHMPEGYDHIFVSVGEYASAFVLDGQTVVGGFAREFGWSRSASHSVVFVEGTEYGGGVVAVSCDGCVGTLVDINIMAEDATVEGTSSYGVRVTGAADLTLERVTVQGGVGASGYHGAAGEAGEGGSGGSVGTCGGGPPNGGAAGTATGCSDGGDGGDARGAGSAGADGACGGDAGVWSDGSGAGGAGCLGDPGAAGDDGEAATDGTGVVSGGWWWGHGGNNGLAGVAGGGGGGGGGGIHEDGSDGAGGGGGGAGGCGGTGGTAGAAGGGSFGLFVVSGDVTVIDSSIYSSRGGDGGAGGDGGDGGPGGAGALVLTDTCGVAGDGGAGGDGGNGGDGGSGSGGAGGVSYPIVVDGGSVTKEGTVELIRGDGGAGGFSLGNLGPDGVSGEEYP